MLYTDEQILRVAAQTQMAANAKSTVAVDSDHSPFLSCPETLADVIVRILGRDG